jgi:hypothetical protein
MNLTMMMMMMMMMMMRSIDQEHRATEEEMEGPISF